MRILALTSSWPRHAEDHCGRFVADLHEALQGLGHSVTTIAPASDGAPASEASAAGEVIRVGGDEGLFQRRGLEHELRRRPWKWRGVVRFLGAAREALAAFEAESDLLLVHWPLPLLRAVPLVWKTPILGIAHGADLSLLRHPLLASLVGRGRVRGRLHGLLTVRRVEPWLIARTFGAVPVAVHPMGANPRVFRPEGRQDPDANGRVLGVGRFEKLKGFDLLLRAAAVLDLPVMLLGDGPERARLVRLARDLKLDLHAPGFRGREGVAAALRAARVLVQPSRRGRFGREEGFPVAVMEARATGCPVLASRTGGLPERLEATELFEADDLPDLVRRLRPHVGSGPGVRRSRDVSASADATARALLALVPPPPIRPR